MTDQYKGKKVAILGLGVEGLSSAKFLAGLGAHITVLDQKRQEELNQDILKEILRHKDIKILGGKTYLNNLQTFDIIVRSPGVRLNLPELKKASQNGSIITSQTKIFFDLCPCPIIGVTGTKGKGTTATLIYKMLRGQGLDAYLGGNIGNPPLDFLEKLKKDSIVVLEMSSFQLLDLAHSPHIAVILMTISEHLDYHKDVLEYVEAKRNILRFQSPKDFAILNRDYPASNESDVHTKGKVFYVSREGEVKEGCFVKGEKVILRVKAGRLPHVANDARRPLEESQDASSSSLSERRLPKSNFDSDLKTVSAFSSFANGQAPRQLINKEIIDTKQILLPGKHNFENVCAAVMAASLCGVSKENMAKVLKTFKGLEHRLELTAEINGVKYYDDSFSTTPETAIAAIQAFENPEILILGGSSKKSDFTELGRVIRDSKNIKAIIGIGVEWKRMKSTIRYTLNAIRYIEGCKNMREIVQKAAEVAKPGDVVLLTPACASFDMFKNYKDRGEQFKREVKGLAHR